MNSKRKLKVGRYLNVHAASVSSFLLIQSIFVILEIISSASWALLASAIFQANNG